MIIFDYVGDEPEGAVRAWRDGLQKGQQAQLDQRLTLLRGTDLDLLPGLMVGPIRVQGSKDRHIYKLRIGGKVRLRPLLCKGPADPQNEITLLVGAFERDWEFVPANAPRVAVDRRQGVLKNAKLRKPYRFPEDETSPLVQG